MDIQWGLIWTCANAVPRKRRGAFADPLERAEWEGLEWSVPLVSRLLVGARAGQKNHQKLKEVERFTVRADEGGVCVS